MPIEYAIRPEAIYLETVGDVDYEKGIAAFEAAVREARAEGVARRPVVFDIRRSEETRSAEELRSIADFVSRHLDVLAPRCAVVTGDDFHFGLGRMFEAFADTHEVEVTVLRSIDDVPAWLAEGPILG
jgi:hypothetical protein